MATEAVETRAGMEDIALDDIVPTEQNPRHIDEDNPALQELADSIEEHGVLEPVLVRPHPDEDGRYELRAGERRWRAAQLAGLETLPAIVRDLDDDEALQVTVTENLQREDLHPLEEARGIESLVESGWQIRDVADHLGKSARWVARRRRLTELVEEWVEKVEDPDNPVSEWPQGHLVEIAKLNPDVQRDLSEELWVENHMDIPTRRKLRDRIARHCHEIESAPWPLDHNIDALMPQCAQCEKRSSRKPLLFDEMAIEEGDRCLDPECWQNHLKAWVLHKAAELYDQYGANLCLITSPFNAADLPSNELPDVERMNRYDCYASNAEAEGARPGLVISGRDMGEIEWVKSHSSVGNTGGPMSWDEKRDRLTGRRAAHVLDALVEIIEESEAPADNSDGRLLRLACAFGVKTRLAPTVYPDQFEESYDRTERFYEMQEKPHEVAQRLVWEGVKPALITALGYHTKTGCQNRLPRARRVCELMDVSFERLAREAREEIPTPKSWPTEQDPDDFTCGLTEKGDK